MYFLSFDIGYKRFDYGLFNDCGVVFQRGKKESIISSIEELVEEIKKVYYEYSAITMISGVCLSCTGIIDSKSGIIKEVHRLPFLDGFEIKKTLENIFGVSVTIENNAKCTALAEVWFGNARNYKDYIYLTMEYGVGGAVVKNKKIHYGSHLYAGEFGLMMFKNDKKGEVQKWGELVSLVFLIERCKTHLNLAEISWEDLYNNHRNSNERVKEEMDEYFFNIALGIYNLQFLYDPEAILLDNKLGVINEINLNLTKLNENNGYFEKVPLLRGCELEKDSRLIGALFNYLFGQ